jgi:hypothetical protein
MTIAIAFQGGSYGSYLKWVLYQLLYSDEIKVPWDTGNTSHNMDYIVDSKVKRFHLSFKNIERSNNYELFTIHPVVSFNDNFIKNSRVINDHVDKILFPYPDNNTYLHALHGYLNKVWVSDNKWNTSLSYIDPLDLKTGWGVDNPANAPKWILREYFSYNIFNSFNSQIGWYAPNYVKFGHFVLLSDLLYDFQNAVEEIRMYLGVNWKRDPLELQPYHNNNVLRQENKNQDILAKNIIESIAGNPISWNANDLTIYTEAYIQKSLQDQGIMLKCTDLNNFPTSTERLIEVFE